MMATVTFYSLVSTIMLSFGAEEGVEGRFKGGGSVEWAMTTSDDSMF